MWGDTLLPELWIYLPDTVHVLSYLIRIGNTWSRQQENEAYCEYDIRP